MNLTDLTYNYLIDRGIATASELELITDINGYNLDAVNDVLYIRTGYRDVEQYTEYEDTDYYMEYFKDWGEE